MIWLAFPAAIIIAFILGAKFILWVFEEDIRAGLAVIEDHKQAAETVQSMHAVDTWAMEQMR